MKLGMCTIYRLNLDTAVPFAAGLAFFVALFLFLCGGGADTPVPAGQSAYLPTCLLTEGSMVEATHSGLAYSVRVSPGADAEGPAQILQGNGPARLRLGTYLYRVEHTSPGVLSYSMSGVRLQPLDEVGRVPSFRHDGQLTFSSSCDVRQTAGGSGRLVPFWADGLPASAFVLLPQTCKRGDDNGVRIAVLARNATLEMSGPTPAVEHIVEGQEICVGSRDLLWIAELPFTFTKVPDREAWDAALDERAWELHGTREGLAYPTYSGALKGARLDFHGLNELFKGPHLATARFEPELEDRYQIAVDNSLLCLRLTREGERVVPSLEWADLANPGCPDPMTHQAPLPSRRGVPLSVARVYDDLRKNDRLVAAANRRFRQGDRWQRVPDEVFFAFEWHPVLMDPDAEPFLMPTRLWGVRTKAATWHSLVQPPDVPQAGQVSDGPPPPLRIFLGDLPEPIVDETLGAAAYERAVETGTIQVTGVRGKIAGLAALMPHGDVTLTLVSPLQSALDKLVARRVSFGDKRRRVQGVTAVVYDADDGSVLASINVMPDDELRDARAVKKLVALPPRGDYAPSRNLAWTRALPVGSSAKLLILYCMADQGWLDPSTSIPALAPSVPCGKADLGVGDPDKPEAPGGFCEDAGRGHLPLGPWGPRVWAAEAFGHSCNNFFGLSALLTLRGTAAGDPSTARLALTVLPCSTSSGLIPLSPREWRVCSLPPTPGPGHPSRLRVLVPAAQLAADAQLGLSDETGARGLYGCARRLGWTLEGGGTDPSRKWFPGLSRWLRVFEYPAITSPADVFEDRGALGAIQDSLGMSSKNSALGLAVLYSALLRDDGLIPVPRLLQSDEPPTFVRAFDATLERVQLLREAGRRTLRPGGTAHNDLRVALEKLRKSEAPGYELDAMGKTGTFRLEQPETVEPRELRSRARNELRRCGVLDWTAGSDLPSWDPPAAFWMGHQRCKRFHRVPVHRMATVPASARDSTPPGRLELHPWSTSFVLALSRPQAKKRRSVVLAVIADVPKTSTISEPGIKATEIASLLAPTLHAWMVAADAKE